MEYITNRPIYELCMGAERMPELRKIMWWWYQDIKPEEERNGASEVAEIEEG